jgi:hypothetical protein
MDDLERRVIVLEQKVQHEQELTDWRFADLSRQLQDLQSAPLQQLSAGAMIKLTFAVALPIVVWMITGDLRKALSALRLAAGG